MEAGEGAGWGVGRKDTLLREELFDNPLLSDCVIVLATPESATAPLTSTLSQAWVKLFGHGTILCESSAYFTSVLIGRLAREKMAAAEAARGGGSGASLVQSTAAAATAAAAADDDDGDVPTQPRLLLPVEEADLEAARAVICFFYTRQLPVGAPLPLLLAMLLLSDFLQADAATLACVEALEEHALAATRSSASASSAGCYSRGGGSVKPPPAGAGLPRVALAAAACSSHASSAGGRGCSGCSDPPALDLASVNRVYSLPDSLLLSRVPAVRSGLAALTSACAEHLLRVFGDLHAVLTDRQLLARFQRLCPPAVAAHLRGEWLTADSENAVLLLLDAWMAGPQGRACGPEAKAVLAGCVRVGCLGRSFLAHALPRLPWFVMTDGQRAELAWFCSLSKWERRHVVRRGLYPPPASSPHVCGSGSGSSCVGSGGSCSGTASWYTAPRLGLRQGGEHVLQLEVSRELLRRALREVRRTGQTVGVSSHPHLINGHWLELLLCLHPTRTSPSAAGCYKVWVGLSLPESGGGHEGWLPSVGFAGIVPPMAIARAAISYRRPDGAFVPSRATLRGEFLLPGRGLGHADFFGGCAPPADHLRASAWSPLMHDGKLTFRAAVVGGG